MIPIALLSVVLLVVLNSTAFYKKNGYQVPGKFFPVFFIVVVPIMFGAVGYNAYAQYHEWKNADNAMKYFLPPYQPLEPFVRYVVQFMAMPWVISLAMALLLIAAGRLLDRFRPDIFFERDELYIGASGLFLLGHPLWLWYLPAMLVAALAVQLFCRFIRKASLPERASFYYWWAPVALLLSLAERFLRS